MLLAVILGLIVILFVWGRYHSIHFVRRMSRGVSHAASWGKLFLRYVQNEFEYSMGEMQKNIDEARKIHSFSRVVKKYFQHVAHIFHKLVGHRPTHNVTDDTHGKK